MTTKDDDMQEINFSEKFNEEFKKARKSIKKPNILVLGGTGAGKSSLINLVFGKELATVGAGESVTSGIHSYENELIRIYDSEGYESGEEGQTRYKNKVLDFVTYESRGLENRVNLVWYCISLANHRVFDIDTKTINEIVKTKRPIAVILTQADRVTEADSKALEAVIRESCPGIEIFEISTDIKTGLTTDSLIDWAYKNLDEALREGFVAGAKNAITQKRKQSLSVVVQHAATAATVAASPIPFSDAPLLVSNQIAMIARLASIWDLPAIKSVAAGGVFAQLVSQLGRTLVGNIAKLIPGFGSAAGAAINATVASSITGAIGYSITEICEKISNDELEGKNNNILDYFKDGILEQLIKSKM